jgi:DNA polymerase III subunit beta
MAELTVLKEYPVKFRVDRNVLADAVAWSARTLPTRPTLPMLAGLLLNADATGLSFSSYDYDVSSQVTVEAAVDEAGKVLVSGRLLADIAKSLPSDTVTLTTDGNRVDIKCGRASFTLPTLPVDEYPQLPQLPAGGGSVTGASFAAAVAQVAIAAGRDESLPMLTGVQLEFDGSSLTLAATDRYRLAVRDIEWAPDDAKVSTNAIVPWRALSDTAKALAGVTSVRIAFGGAGAEHLLGFEGDGRRTTTGLLDATFPDYKRLLPSESNTLVTFDTTELADALKRVALVAERHAPVRLAVHTDDITLSAGTGDEATAEESIEARITGEPLEIAFNPAYLLDGLSAVGTPLAQLAFTASTRPAVLAPATDDGARTDYKYLLMPIRLTG